MKNCPEKVLILSKSPVVSPSNGLFPHFIYFSYEWCTFCYSFNHSFNRTAKIFIQRIYSFKKTRKLFIQKKSKIIHSKISFIQKKSNIIHSKNLFIQKKSKIIHSKNLFIQEKNKIIHSKKNIHSNEKWIIAQG